MLLRVLMFQVLQKHRTKSGQRFSCCQEPTMSDKTKIKGMGAIPHAGGIAFRVWAPHAQRVSVIGSFNGWDGGKHPMQAEENGSWYADVAAGSCRRSVQVPADNGAGRVHAH